MVLVRNELPLDPKREIREKMQEKISLRSMANLIQYNLIFAFPCFGQKKKARKKCEFFFFLALHVFGVWSCILGLKYSIVYYKYLNYGTMAIVMDVQKKILRL